MLFIVIEMDEEAGMATVLVRVMLMEFGCTY